MVQINSIEQAFSEIKRYASNLDDRKDSDQNSSFLYVITSRLETLRAISYLSTNSDKLKNAQLTELNDLKTNLNTIEQTRQPQKTWKDTAIKVLHVFTCGISYLIQKLYHKYVCPSREELQAANQNLQKQVTDILNAREKSVSEPEKVTGADLSCDMEEVKPSGKPRSCNFGSNTISGCELSDTIDLDSGERGIGITNTTGMTQKINLAEKVKLNDVKRVEMTIPTKEQSVVETVEIVNFSSPIELVDEGELLVVLT